MQQYYPVPGAIDKYRFGVLLSVLLMSTTSIANVPVNIRGTVIIPPPCTINNNQTIRVDFGDEVMTTRIDGVNYKQAITYSLNCDIQKSNNLKMSIQGTGASFNSALLRTDKNGLGIALYRGTQPLNANAWFNYTYPSKPELYAVLVKQSGATLTGGEFTAAATLLIDYQ
jgi:type 1 fimbria pilin